MRAKLKAAAWSQTWPAPGSTLDLDFANNRGWVRGVGQGGVMDAITFTRASTGRYIDQNGLLTDAVNGVPRFDWASPAPVAPVNLLNYTEDFGNAYWAKTAVTVTSDATAAPDGTTTADRIAADGSASAHFVQGGFGSAATHTLTIRAKADTATHIHILQTGANQWAQFSLSTGLVSFSSGVVAATSTDLGSGWWLFDVEFNTFFGTVRFYPLNAASNTASPSQATTASMFLWGAQLELGSTATAYQAVAQPTTNTPLAANPTCNGILIEESRTNRILWCRDATSGTGTNMLIGSSSNIYWTAANGSIAETLGPELITNGDFSSGSTGWKLTSGWAVSGGALVGTSVPGFNNFVQTTTMVAGTLYRVTFNLTVTAGSLQIGLPNGAISGSAELTTGGAYSFLWYAGGASFAGRAGSGGFTGSIDNISVKAVSTSVADPDGNNTASTATATSANATFTQAVNNSASLNAPGTFSVWLRRRTGTGNVDITATGSTWVTQTITSSWARYSVTQLMPGNSITPGIRIVTSGDQVDVWGPQFFPGYALTEYQPTTSTALFGWSQSNVTLAKNQTGADGVANAATSITADANNAFLIQPILLSFAARTCSVYLKRITGTGTVQVSLDGTTWSTVDLSSTEWRRIVLSGTVTNPVVGIKLATNGDAVAMDYAQVEDGAFATSPILTTTATATRSRDALTIPSASWVSLNSAIWYSELFSNMIVSTSPCVVSQGLAGGATFFLAFGVPSYAGASDGVSSTVAPPVAARNVLTTSFSKVAWGYSTSVKAAATNGVTGGENARFYTSTSSFSPARAIIPIGSDGAGNLALNGCLKRLIHVASYKSDQSLVEMTRP
jgi:hypothetical protein